MKYEYLKGSEKDFEGAPEWAHQVIKSTSIYGYAFVDEFDYMCKYQARENPCDIGNIVNPSVWKVIAERRPITEPSWNGAGLPPVGCECEVKVGGDNYNLCRIVYSDSNAGVAFVYLGGDDEKYCGTIDCVTAGAAYGYFRPIRSEADKKRDAVIHEIAEAMVAPQPKGNGILAQAISVYNKIASGKIPGVKLED